MIFISGTLQALIGGLGVVVVVGFLSWLFKSFQQFKQMNKSLNRLCDQMETAIGRIDDLEHRVERIENRQ